SLPLDATKALRANGICMPSHNPPKPTWPRVLVCSSICLPDERHITGPRSGTAIVDKDRVCAGHLDLHVVAVVDVHDVESHVASGSTGDARRVRFQAGPNHAGAGSM